MKFTVAALLIASTNAVMLRDDDGKGNWVNKGLPYDHDVPTLNKAEADNVAKTQAFNGATNAAAAAAGAAKTKAAADFAATPYTDGKFPAAEAANTAAVKAEEATLDAHLRPSTIKS